MPDRKPPPRPHRLALYERAVQHPLAELAMLEKVARHHGAADTLYTLREDFAGGAALAEAFVLSHPDREAIAVERHGPTHRWSRRNRGALEPEGLHLVEADVLDFHGPRCDAIHAGNFSVLGWHTRADLVRYLRHARRCLTDGGVFLMDTYGGPGAQRISEQHRRVDDTLGYTWAQTAFDPVSQRARCAIHLRPAGHPELRNAFRYDWRLWSPAELTEALAEAGFEAPTVWLDRGDGTYRPHRRAAAREDYIAYVSAQR